MPQTKILTTDLVQALSISLSSFILGVALLGGNHPAPQNADSPLRPVQEAFPPTLQSTPNTQFPEASLEEVIAASQSSNTLLIDARPRLLYDIGHIPNALHISPENSKNPNHLPNPEIYSHLIIYCSHRGCPDSETVAKNLRPTFPNIKLFKDGWEVWSLLDLPIQKSSQ